MNQDLSLSRSPELMTSSDTALLVVDVQEKLIGHIPAQQRLVWNIRRLIDGAKLLNLAVVATEQYPRGLGPTTSELAQRLGAIPEKMTFSCAGCPQIFEDLAQQGVHKVLVVGIEAHVCIQQTVFDMLSRGFRVYVAVDAIGSRFSQDRDVALRRMESAGTSLTTTEAALFEWCEAADTPQFKQISALVREACPSADQK